MGKQFRLPKEFAEKWLKDLRSGEYKQGREVLSTIPYGRKDIEACCLGVSLGTCGADLYDEHVLNISMPTDLDVELLDEIGYPLELIDLGTKSLPKTLAVLNDSGDRYLVNRESLKLRVEHHNPLDFNEIADFIEDNVEFY